MLMYGCTCCTQVLYVHMITCTHIDKPKNVKRYRFVYIVTVVECAHTFYWAKYDLDSSVFDRHWSSKSNLKLLNAVTKKIGCHP